MSTGIGTLQAPKTSRSIWPAAVIASLLMLSIGIGVFFLGRGPAAQAPATTVGGTEQTVVGATVANTPSELSGGIRHKFGSDAPTILSGGTTPTELTGGFTAAEAFRRTAHQRI